MGHYKGNLRDIEFNLFEVLGRDDVLGTGPFAEVDEETARDMLAEVNKLALGPAAESFTDGDRNPPVFDPATSSVTLPESFKKSYRTVMDAEWWRLSVPPELGGTVVPFANRQDNDDVACFDLDRGGISIIHDFASVGWEQREVYPTFYAWLRQAVEDLIEFEPED